MTKFVAEITVGKRDRLVTLRIPAGNTIAPSLRQVSVTFDGETSHHHREPISSTVLEYHPMPGTHRLEIDFGGPMPAATLILPEQTTAIISPIPALYNDATGMLSTAGHIWNPIKPPRQLTHLVSSLFAHNTHLVALSGTFAGLTALTEVPESLFFPLIYARTFTGVFALSGLAHVSRQLFTANLQAEDFSEDYIYACKTDTDKYAKEVENKYSNHITGQPEPRFSLKHLVKETNGVKKTIMLYILPLNDEEQIHFTGGKFVTPEEIEMNSAQYSSFLKEEIDHLNIVTQMWEEFK